MAVAENLRTAEASVSIAGTKYDLPMRKGTLGPDVVDIGALYQDTGHFTYDPGFTSTARSNSRRVGDFGPSSGSFAAPAHFQGGP